ncbi:hypothetical protein Rs2_35653 [Raphanus sativus]|nr:hypothetical protein Rs2_35653 [Raphanus sativus]
MGIVEVLVFPYVELREWISWMEDYFDRKGHTDFEKLHMAHGFIWGEAESYIYSLKPIISWKEMKETFLLRFGEDDDPEKKIILKARYARGQEDFINREAEKRQGFDNVLSHEKERVKNETFVAVDDETDSVLTKESVHELHQETAMRNDTDFTESLKLSCSLIEESSCSSEVVPEIELLKKTALPNEEDVSADLETGLGCAHAATESMQSADSDSVMEVEMQITKPSDTEVIEEKSVEVMAEVSMASKIILEKDILAETLMEVPMQPATLLERDLILETDLSCDSVTGNFRDESACSKEVVHETEIDKQTASVEVVSVASVAGVHQKISISAPVQETEVVPRNSLAETGQETNDGETGVTGCSAVAVHLQVESTWSSGIVHETALEGYNTRHWRKMRQPHAPRVMFKRQVKTSCLSENFTFIFGKLDIYLLET